MASAGPASKVGGARRVQTTPKSRKRGATDDHGVKKSNWTPQSIQKKLEAALGIQYTPDQWQLAALQNIVEGYDSIVLAGTGYGKSLLFEGSAVLAGKGKAVVVICPLKALGNDQVRSIFCSPVFV